MSDKKGTKRAESAGGSDRKVFKKPRTEQGKPGGFVKKGGKFGGQDGKVKKGPKPGPWMGPKQGTGAKKPFKKTEGEEGSTEEKKRSEIKKERKLAKPHGDVVSNGNRLWNTVRQKNVDADKKKAALEELMGLVRGNMHDIIMRHDAVRFIQCCVQYGDEKQRAEIFEELKEHIPDLMKHTYSKFLVKKMLDYGTKAHREFVIKTMYGNVAALLKHKEASMVVEAAYNDWATAPQRHALMQEFYGPEFKSFKDMEHGTLAELIAANPTKKQSYLDNLCANLTGAVNKGTLTHSIIHALLAEFFNHADDSMKQDMAALVSEHIASILHTRDGMKVSQHCIWLGSPKLRKQIIKSFKTLVSKICMEEHGHHVLFSLFDSVDDTVLLKKSILNEIIADLSNLTKDKYGRLTILYLIAPRASNYFNPQVVASLKIGDANPNSKKTAEARQNELREAMSAPLIEYCTENMYDMVREGPLSQLVEEVILNAAGDKSALIEALLTEVEGKDSIIQIPVPGLMLKRLISKNFMVGDKHIGELLWPRVEANLEDHVETKQACYTLATLLTSELADEFKDTVAMAIAQQFLPNADVLDKNGKPVPGAVLRKAVTEHREARGLAVPK
eukprot:Ihof_evm1s212 gene=Ihof_evmTU1s212